MTSLHQLQVLLRDRGDLRQALEAAIRYAAFPGIDGLDDYYRFLSGLLTQVPTRRDMDPTTTRFHYIVNCSPGGLLQTDDSFQQWLVDFSRDHGSFLDTPESALALDSFINDPGYSIDDYYRGPSGWLTFNQFFARNVRPGRRPIAGPGNSAIVVSPTDSIYKGCWPIDDQASLVVKGTEWRLSELLGDGPWFQSFAGGVFTHSYLDVTDYHRYHLPAGGVVREALTIPGRVKVSVDKKNDGEFVTKDDIGFQFRQTRGVVILETELGLIAIVPVGMGHVSSVNLVVEAGDNLVKGQEFGYFAYGGSDLILLFQRDRVRFTAIPGAHYKQGEQLAVGS
jgi:phosphatidylserine decarboxylase